jgi:hypothetical protein
MIITITIITDNRLQVRSFPDTAGTALWRAVCPCSAERYKHSWLQQRLQNCGNCGASVQQNCHNCHNCHSCGASVQQNATNTAGCSSTAELSQLSQMSQLSQLWCQQNDPKLNTSKGR